MIGETIIAGIGYSTALLFAVFGVAAITGAVRNEMARGDLPPETRNVTLFMSGPLWLGVGYGIACLVRYTLSGSI